MVPHHSKVSYDPRIVLQVSTNSDRRPWKEDNKTKWLSQSIPSMNSKEYSPFDIHKINTTLIFSAYHN